MKKRLLAASAAIAVLAACNPSAPTEQAATPVAEKVAVPTELGKWGVELDQMNSEIRPGDDFFRYVNGKWLDSFVIPADKSGYGSFTVLRDRSETQVRAIIQDAAKAGADTGSPEQKIGDLYASFMDAEALEAKGLSGLQGDLDAITAASNHDDIASLMARPDMRANGLFGGFVNVDSKQTDSYIFYIGQSGLGLPNRDYYLDDDDRSKELRSGYQAHIANMLKLADVADAE
ncbi:Metallopeptidase, partial [hydrothermal vent metagenome]